MHIVHKIRVEKCSIQEKAGLTFSFLCSVLYTIVVVLLYFILSLYCLSFVDLHLMITRLISLNFSKKHSVNRDNSEWVIVV